MPHIIDDSNYPSAEAAIRDILFMYTDMIQSYSGFGHNIDTGDFDPFLYLDSILVDRPGTSLELDLPLLHQGSAVAILCVASNHWDECAAPPDPNSKWGSRFCQAIEQGRYSHLHVAKVAAEAALTSENIFRDRLSTVYEEYVVHWLSELLDQAGGTIPRSIN